MLNPDEMTAREFAEAVAGFGAQGMTQDQIAAEFGLSRNQVRHRLLNTGYTWTSNVLVKLSLTGDVVAPVEAVAA